MKNFIILIQILIRKLRHKMAQEKSSNIIDLDKHRRSCDEILEDAKTELTSVIIIGWNKGGDLYTDCNVHNPEAVYLLEIAKNTILR